MENSIIANNAVTESGGAINVAGGTLVVRGSSITGNSAEQSGGGILVRGYYDDRNPTLILENTLVKDNSAGVTGGGIAVTDHEINFSSVTVDNQSRIYDNSALPVVVKYGDTYTVSDDGPSRDGYTFRGWNTRPDGSGITLVAGDTYDGSDGWTLYAQWEEIKTDDEVTPSDDANPPADVNPPADDATDEDIPVNPITNDDIVIGLISFTLSAVGISLSICARRR